MSWHVPPQAARLVLYGLDGSGEIQHYGRDQDDAGGVVWRRGDPHDLFKTFSGGPSMTTAELLEALATSLSAET